MRLQIIAASFLLIFAMSMGVSGESKTKITGIYSNLTYNHDGGDLFGVEVFIVDSRHGYYVVFQSSEGEPSDPIVVKAQVKGTAVSFVVPESVDSRGEFHGEVTNDELVGSFFANGRTVHLKRKNSYWQ